MRMESAPESYSDRIEKKEVLSEVESAATVPACARKLWGDGAGRRVNQTAAEESDGFQQPYFGETTSDCPIENCERSYRLSNQDGKICVDGFTGICLETAVAIGKRILPEPDDIF